MKSLCVILIVVITLVAPILSCDTDNDCPDGCCINFGLWKSCRSKGSSNGAACQGAVTCDCKLPYVCLKHEQGTTLENVYNVVRQGSGQCWMLGIRE